jgi:hypothetical protein
MTIRWHYSDYPVLKDGNPTMTSGNVEIEMTAPPWLPVIKMGPNAEPNIVPRPLEQARWRVDGDVPDDLKRFIRGKYWPQIESALLAQYLQERR